MTFAIESRYPAWARWRTVHAAPHGERWPFNPTTRALEFPSLALAVVAVAALSRANAAEFRVVPGKPFDLKAELDALSALAQAEGGSK